MRGIDLMISALDRAECNPRKFGESWRSQCPSHGSKGGTLKVSEARDRVLFHCFAGCSYDEVLGSLGLSWGDLVEEKSGPIVVRPRKAKREPVWVDPVRSARAYGCRLVGPREFVVSESRVYVGQCSCGASVTAGVGGAFCENKCPIEAVGRLLLDFRDAQLRVEGGGMEVRTLNVLGCVEKKRGTSKQGRDWVLYAVQADDGNGNPIGEDLTSFQQLPVGVGEYQVEREENQWGVRWTIKQPTAVGRALSEQNVRITRLEALCQQLGGGTAQVAPAAPAPVVVQSGDVPF